MHFNDLKPIPPRPESTCFGCGTENKCGLSMRFFTDDKKVYSKVAVPKHLGGWNNIAHGGVISTMLDEIMSWSGIYILKRFILTKSITANFYKPVMLEEELTVEGWVHERVNEREAIMKGVLKNSEGIICAASTGTFALFTKEALKKLNIADDRSIEILASMIE